MPGNFVHTRVLEYQYFLYLAVLYTFNTCTEGFYIVRKSGTATVVDNYIKYKKIYTPRIMIPVIDQSACFSAFFTDSLSLKRELPYPGISGR